ncbi:ribosomal-protein-S5-alanine N-acetyltransferase [Candidatus Izimaplasma bacterium HR1]|jgi:RimJ/RimL family protein N-acetyltransferase|uniref:GNAT family N-acetyltransferase n=1 Tax=Candidatus Izimoplasma sp. HR1 TaxID=1541959 RepID=UPI0004F7D383|nr:ribosomal-protein-S5-alanine N-acetyltransferase [Candidatus Izimaplasma bacterium HR1]
MKTTKHRKVLTYLAKELNNCNINWALGASFMLYFEGIKTTVDDIDLLVDENDYEKLLELLKPYPYTYIESNPKYQTDHFFSLELDGVAIDIMLGFKVKTKNGLYSFPFHISKSFELDNETIYLSSLEEWLNAYKAMGRDKKVKIVEDHLSFRIETDRTYISLLNFDDTKAMFEYMSEESVHTFEDSEPYDVKQMNRVMTYIVPLGSYYSVKLKESNKHIGHIYFGLSNPERFKEYAVGYIFNNKYQNKGYCTESTKALIDYGFNHLDINRVKAMCNPDNIPSWRVMEKVGLKKEGHLKKRVHFKDDNDGNPIWWDEYIYGITKEDW